MKNANASSANGSPITEPHRPISPGQNSPSANDRTVPETAPIATRMPSAFAHRRVSAIQTASPRADRAVLGEEQHQRQADAERREHDVEAERDGHLRPGRLQRGQRQPDAITSTVGTHRVTTARVAR